MKTQNNCITLKVINNFGCNDVEINSELFLSTYEYPISMWDSVRDIVNTLVIGGESRIIEDIEVIRIS